MITYRVCTVCRFTVDIGDIGDPACRAHPTAEVESVDVADDPDPHAIPEPVILESPYAGPRRLLHEHYLRAALRDSLMRGEAPLASHAIYTLPGVLRDEGPDERARGIAAGFAWRAAARRTVVYADLGTSPGMRAGMVDAERKRKPWVERSLPDWGEVGRAADRVEAIAGGPLELRYQHGLIALAGPRSPAFGSAADVAMISVVDPERITATEFCVVILRVAQRAQARLDLERSLRGEVSP